MREHERKTPRESTWKEPIQWSRTEQEETRRKNTNKGKKGIQIS
jgi:hypothetical protein